MPEISTVDNFDKNYQGSRLEVITYRLYAMLWNWTYQDYDSIAKQSDTSTGSVDTQLVVLTGQCARFSLTAKQNCITANQIFFLHTKPCDTHV